MFDKKTILFTALSICSIFAGALLGKLDLFGFIDGRHALSFVFMISSIILMYFITILVFVLNFGNRSKVETIFLGASLLFGLTFFLMNLHLLLSIGSAIFFFLFLTYTYSESHKRSLLYIKFSPREIFFPILRKHFVYLMVIFTLLTYSQAKNLLLKQSLLTPSFIKVISKPSVGILNKQLNSQLDAQLSGKFKAITKPQDREKLIKLILSETVKNMTDVKTKKLYGFKAQEIPVEDTIVYNNGTVDISPVIEAMLPEITNKLNAQIQRYAVIVPFIIAFLVFLILQTFLLPFQIVESFLTLVIFHVLLRVKFICIEKESREVERLHL